MQIDGREYKPVKIDKLLINGVEQKSTTITAEQTQGIQELNVTVYTKPEDSIGSEEEK